MAPDKDSDSQVALPAIDERLVPLVAEVEGLVMRICEVPPSTEARDESMVVVEAPLAFPDGIGAGTVQAMLFTYREYVRLDVRLLHNRVFALAGGGPSERVCFLNDYVASHKVAEAATELPKGFVRQVVSGVAAARDAVRRHNRKARGPWDEVNVAAVE